MSIFDLTSNEGSAPDASGGGSFGPAAAGAGGLLGLGLGLAGTAESFMGASAISEASGKIAGFEMQENQVRRQMMETTARRETLQAYRNAQQARARALTANVSATGTSQGSAFGGAMGQISGESTTNLLGIGQNLEAGEQMFDLSNQISTQRMRQSQAQGQMATGSALSSLGSSLGSSMGSIANLAAFL